MLFPCKKTIGVYDKNELSTLRYVFEKPTDGSAHNKALTYWTATTSHNSVLEFREYSVEFGLPLPPGNLKVMVTNWGFMVNSGSAPLSSKCYNNPITAEYARFFIAQSSFVGAGLTALTNVLKNRLI